MRLIACRRRLPVQCVALSADGAFVATAQPAHGVGVRNVWDGTTVAFLPRRGDPGYRKLVFADAARFVAVVAQTGVDVLPVGGAAAAGGVGYPDAHDVRFTDADQAFDVVSEWGSRRHTVADVLRDGHRSATAVPAMRVGSRLVALSPDGRRLVADPGDDRQEIWVYVFPERSLEGRLRTAFAGRGAAAGWADARFTPAGDRIVVVGCTAVEVFDWSPCEVPRPLPVVEYLPPEPNWQRRWKRFTRVAADAVFGRASVAASPAPAAIDVRFAGPPVAASLRFGVTPAGRPEDVPPFALAPNGRLLVRGWDGRIEARDLLTGGVLAEWDWGCGPVRSLAVAGNGLTAAAGFRGQVVVWDLE